MNVRFYNARIAGMKSDTSVIEGELWVVGNHIAYIGNGDITTQKTNSFNQLHEITWERQINCRGNLILPGFKNAHTHSAMTFLRSYADDMPLMEWLTKQVFPMEAKLTPEDIYHLSKLAIMEYLTSGITANFDMYLTPDTIAQASIDCGFRTVMCGGISDFSFTIPMLEEWYRKYNNYHELIGYQFGFHGEYTASKELLLDLAALAKQYKAPVYSHNSETVTEVESCLKRNGKTPTVYLSELGIFDYGGGGFHCVHMTKEDIAIFKEKELFVITNPGSNTKLASGIAGIQEFIDNDITVAIGTDGPASNNCLDMFREMFLVTGLAKLRESNAAAVGANLVLQMSCVNGAKAMQLPECDCLEVGKLADLILIDLNQPNMQPLNNITKNVVYSGSKQNVKLTMINGNILYENGEFHIGTDPEEVYARANEIIKSKI